MSFLLEYWNIGQVKRNILYNNMQLQFSALEFKAD